MGVAIIPVTEGATIKGIKEAYIYVYISRLTIVSREAKKKQHTRPLSELFTCSTALKLANALAKPP